MAKKKTKAAPRRRVNKAAGLAVGQRVVVREAGSWADGCAGVVEAVGERVSIKLDHKAIAHAFPASVLVAE